MPVSYSDTPMSSLRRAFWMFGVEDEVEGFQVCRNFFPLASFHVWTFWLFKICPSPHPLPPPPHTQTHTQTHRHTHTHFNLLYLDPRDTCWRESSRKNSSELDFCWNNLRYNLGCLLLSVMFVYSESFYLVRPGAYAAFSAGGGSL